MPYGPSVLQIQSLRWRKQQHQLCQLRQLSGGLADPAQGCAEGVPEAGGRCNGVAPQAESGEEMGHSH